jgi:pSer/pThr/pTyr-binding forkhead associated (FHA) protein
MIARLVSLDGDAEILLGGPLILLGRAPWCDVRVASPWVSRVHCTLAPHGDGVTVRDLGSTNGTRINGLCAGEGLLRAGDVLTLADVRYRLEPGREAGAGHHHPTRVRDPGEATPRDTGAV